jgi:SNF2 family DNA or RNA helicase
MATLDNMDDGLIYYVERNEIYPENHNLQYMMKKSRIINIINDETLHKTFEYIDTNYSFDHSNFKTKIKDSFVLTNGDVVKFYKKIGWTCNYLQILKQTLIPVDAIQYYVINFVNKTNTEMTYNHFIIAIRIESSKVSDEFKKIFGHYLAPGQPRENINFIQFLKCLQKYDFEEMNNLVNKSDENTEISTRIKKANTNYMTQKMIEQPKFLNFPLYYYQRADVFFMLQRESESETRKFILDEKRVVNWGKKLQCIFDKDSEGRDICTFIPRRTIHNYTGVLNSFCGGCLCNDPGLGKTIEILTLCGMAPSLNLVIVPDHLFDHWIFEYNKHIKENHIELIIYTNDGIDLKKYKSKSAVVLITYHKLTVFKKLLSTQFTRLIIDEFHELFDKKDKTFPLINDVKAQYKWAVTGTPLLNSSMITNVLNFIAKNKITSPNIAKYKMYLDVFCEMFRKNTKESVTIELSLPKIKEMTYILTLSEVENTMLNSICSSGIDKETAITRQMAFCINPNLYFQDEHGISEKYIHVNICEAKVINMHQADYEKLFKKVIAEKINFFKLKEDPTMTNWDVITIYDYVVNKNDNFEKRKDILSRFYENKLKLNGKKVDIDDIDKDSINKIWKNYLSDKIDKNNLVSGDWGHYEADAINHIKKLEADLESIRSTMIYFEQQIKLINKKTNDLKRKSEDDVVDYVLVEETKEEDIITCSICLGEIDDDFTLLQCGHSFCTPCLRAILAHSSDKCPQCMFSLKNTTFYTPRLKQIVNKDFAEMVKKYGTKIAHLINICRNIIPEDKTIVYCDSPSLINNLVEILNENYIKANTPSPTVSIMETVKDFELKTQVLVLSSEFNASGLNIQFAKSIILLQPIRGEYSRVRQIENQIIGRLHRIGQTKEVNLIRLIIKDSVESEILRQNKIIDLEFTGSNMKTDYPMTEAEVKELDA